MPLANGETFAGHTILGLLGSGGMGEVYLAIHPRLPRRVALKILPGELSADAEFRERFNREADLVADLYHPNIVGVNDRGDEMGQLWISMDYVEGTDAAQLMRDRYPAGMPAAEVITIIDAVARALDYAHHSGLLHRDVKPSNILLTNPDDHGERRIMLADFGVARELAEVSGLTATNLTVGTVAYAAPEQLMGSDIDGRADQYALAASAFHLFTGSPVYQHSNPVAVISQHLSTTPPKLSDRRRDLADFDPVLSEALAKDPADRFDTCRQFAEALSERHNDASIGSLSTKAGVTAPAALPTTAPKPRGRRRRHVLIGAAAAAVIAVILGVTGFLIVSEKATSPATSASPAGPVLDGTYRLVYDDSKQTANGAPDPPNPLSEDIKWWAFRSRCTSTGCTATATGLDNNNPQVARNPAATTDLHFVNGHWDQTPERSQVNHPQCLGVDGTLVAGADTQVAAWSMEPQPDGTLRGVLTKTVVTNECSGEGSVLQIPFVATRTGEVPGGVTVADPVGLPASPSTSTPAPPPGGPVLDGTYRFDLDQANQTVNGRPTIGAGPKQTYWWSFRSLCTPTRCVAVGAALSDNNQQEPSGSATVLRFTEGQWQDDAPYVQGAVPCDQGYTNGGNKPGGNGADISTAGLSLQPQADGTLRGVETLTVLTNDCGMQGNVYKTPIVATRIGDVPPAVVLADPALL